MWCLSTTFSVVLHCMLARGSLAFATKSSRRARSYDRTLSLMAKPKVLILAGPTAVGKSDVAAKLCQSLQGLIVSADSVQAYRGVQIGANKPTPDELAETPHLLVDVADHTMNYNAAAWREDAVYCIKRLLRLDDIASHPAKPHRLDDSIRDALLGAETATPVVVGGTMMYLQWLVHGRPDAVKPTESAVEAAAKRLASFREDWGKAVAWVSTLDNVLAKQVATLAGKDWYRLRRILEVYYAIEDASADEEEKANLLARVYTGVREGSLESLDLDVRCFFLCPSDRMNHTRVIDERCEDMIERGLLRETADLWHAGILPEMASKAIGYRQVLDYLLREDARNGDGDAFGHFLDKFTTATRQYAKRQMQWFRKDEDFVFVPVNVNASKPERVARAHAEILRIFQLGRSDFDAERLGEDSLSSKTRQNNEEQGPKMKSYQFKRFRLKDGSDAAKQAIAEADEQTRRLQSKRKREVAESV